MSFVGADPTQSTVVGTTPHLDGVDLSKINEVEGIWRLVVEELAAESPQNRAFLSTTKALGLLQREGGATLLLEAPLSLIHI